VSEESKEDSVVDIAKQRFQRAKAAYSLSRQLAIDDTRFALGDSDNGWQWPEGIRQSRQIEQKVCLTVNMTAQHVNQTVNNMRQNRPQCRVLPVDNGSDKKTAEIFGGLIRNIQTSSNADDAHDVAAEHSCIGGEGYWRILTQYEDEKSFNQKIVIQTLSNPQLVYVDDLAKELDKSDAEWGMIFDDISKSQCKRDYPDVDPTSWVADPGGWVKADTVRIAEYYYCEYVPDKALLFSDGSTSLKSELPKGAYEAGKENGHIVDERDTTRKTWKWCKLVGGHDQPVDVRDWAGKYLPIVSAVGKQLNVDGEVITKGMVRDLKDPARMVNFSYSEAVQTIALQNKIPYIAAAEAIEGYENTWKTANVTNAAYLPYNAYDDEGRQIAKPERQQPSVLPAAQVQMLQLSTEQMRAASGQQNANFGIKSEASSGVGIQRLKAQGEIATFHFPDNQVRALRYEARILIDLIPKVYDTKRVIRILGIDGKEEKVEVDPELQGAYQEDYTEEDVKKIFNPNVGKYDVVIDTGPSYQTQRQEAFTFMTELAKTDQGFMQNYGDIVFRASDIPYSDQLAKRAEKMLPPQLQEKKGQPQIPPEVQQQMEQGKQTIQQLSTALENAHEEVTKMETEKLAKEKELEVKRVEANTKAYSAITDRLQVLGPLLTPEEVQGLAQETKREAMEQPDPGQAPAESMGIPEQEIEATEQPIEQPSPQPEPQQMGLPPVV
jgi:hypothetical protein